MSLQIEVWSDFVCPFCFAASASLAQLEAMHDVEITWRSYELRPDGAPPMPEAYKERIMSSRPQLSSMMWENFGIRIQPGPLGISSHKALVGAKVAEAQDESTGRAYRQSMLNAYWIEGRSIDDVTVIKDVAREAGMDPDDFVVKLDDPQYENAVQMDAALAQHLGLRGVPAQVFDKRYLVSGWRRVEDLAEMVEQITAEEQGS